MIKKKYLIIILIVLFLVVLLLILHPNRKSGDKGTLKDIKGAMEIDMCKSSTCGYDSPVYFNTIYVDDDDQLLKSEIKKLNDKKKYYYNLMNDSNMNSKSCSKYRNLYKHSKYVDTVTDKMNAVEFISICVNTIVTDVCTGKVDVIEPEILNYDKINHKKLSQEEFIQMFNITDEEINSAIDRELEKNNLQIDNSKLENISLFYGSNNRILVTFYMPTINKYMYSLVREL